MGLSRDPDAKARQLANLRPGAGAAKAGNARALRHGGRAERPPGLDEARADLFDALAASAPIRAVDGGLPDADAATVELAALALARVRALDSWLAVHGYLDERTGAEKPAVAALERATATAARLLGKLGMNPSDRAALGVDLARGRDLALEWAAEAEAEVVEQPNRGREDERRDEPDLAHEHDEQEGGEHPPRSSHAAGPNDDR